MNESSTSIINHIPHFLTYYKKRGYSVHTWKNYKMYLKKFILWLDKNKKHDLKPHELSNEDISSYKLYLSHYQDGKGHSLKRSTQNYYLIVLRALLSYFIAKDVVSR